MLRRAAFAARAAAVATALAAGAVAFGAAGGTARAEVLARRSLAQPAYKLEIEPHLTLGPSSPPGPGSGGGAGLGVRGSIVIASQGFINGVDDSVAFGFGLDVLRYQGNGGFFGTCVRREPGPAGTSICTEVDGPGAPRSYLLLPVVMQWNFWLTDRWSVFGEPGINLFAGNGGVGASPALFLGGRLRIADAMTLTLRLGWPTVTLGASFLM